ncbi:Fpg/Nei family DNA glycosylase [Streptomyces sp. NPDC004100]
MPELPDVEGFRGVLERCGQGRCVRKVDVRDAGVLRDVTAERLQVAVEGRSFAEPRRHGKFLVAPLDDGSGPALVWHFGMTGALLCAPADEPPHDHDRVLLTLDDGNRLGYRDQRKLQGVRLAETPDDVDALLAVLGPDALTIDRADFLDLLADRRGAVKSLLMDQSALAGLGNLLSDEILWRARIAPDRPAREIEEAEARGLFTAMGRVLDTAVRDARVPPRRNWLTGHRDDPEPECPRCGNPLDSRRVSGRRTVWCPHCQR